MTGPGAAGGLIELDEYSLRPMRGADFGELAPVLESTPREIFDLPLSEAAFRGFVKRVEAEPWSMPMVVRHRGQAVSAFTLTLASPKNANAFLLALMRAPADDAISLALYVRHAFWTYPLHRLYVQLPDTAALGLYRDAYVASGFLSEGVLAAHVVDGGELRDAIVLGLLRRDFDSWCREREPRLAL